MVFFTYKVFILCKYLIINTHYWPSIFVGHATKKDPPHKWRGIIPFRQYNLPRGLGALNENARLIEQRHLARCTICISYYGIIVNSTSPKFSAINCDRMEAFGQFFLVCIDQLAIY